MSASLSGYTQTADKNTNGTDAASTFQTITVAGDADIGGDVTIGGDLAVGGNTTFSGSLTVQPVLYVADATAGGTASGSSIATYRSSSNTNNIQIQNSSTGGTSSDGVLFGLFNADMFLTMLTAGNIRFKAATVDTNEINVRGMPLYIKRGTGSLTSDGTFGSNAAIGAYDATRTICEMQLQNNTTGTGTGAGGVVSMNNLELRVANFESGSTVIRNPAGSLLVNSSGNVVISGDATVNGDASVIGNLSFGSISAFDQPFLGSVQSWTWTFSGSLVANSDFVNAEGQEFYGGFDQIDLVGWTFSAFGGNTTNLVLGITDYTTTIVSGTTFTVGSISGTAGEPRTRNGTFSSVSINAASTALSSRGVRVSSGSGTNQVYTVQVFFRPQAL